MAPWARTKAITHWLTGVLTTDQIGWGRDFWNADWQGGSWNFVVGNLCGEASAILRAACRASFEFGSWKLVEMGGWKFGGQIFWDLSRIRGIGPLGFALRLWVLAQRLDMMILHGKMSAS